MIEQILCFLVLIICLVYGLALLSWPVMKLDIEKSRSKTKFFERIGGNLMEIEKLIKHMRKEAQDYRAGRTLGRAFADAEDVLDEAATALEQLQAELERVRVERDAYKVYFMDVSSKPDCNTCEKMGCGYRPRVGDTVRANCPLYSGPEKEE